MDETKPPRVKDQLADLEVRPKKSRGQNFLHNEGVAQKIAEFSGVGSDDTVLEIGPGLGMLTRHLLERTRELLVVEIDQRLASELPQNVPGLLKSNIITEDVREVSLAEVCSERKVDTLRVVANVPYSISSDIIAWIIDSRQWVSSASLLLQREFAERAAAEPGSKRYGALSVFCGQQCKATLGFVVDGKQFHPPAGVDSRVLKLDVRESPRAQVSDAQLFREIVRVTFSMRRKMLSNSLGSLAHFADHREAGAFLSESGIDPKRRPETISIEEFATISNALSSRAA